MSGFGYSLFGFLLAIAILVAVHEYGHFWVARKLGVKVLKFSIGFGRSIFSWRRRNDPTEYSIGLVPLGGYVKMLDESEGEVAAAERHLAFNTKPLSTRAAVVFAGPLFNFLFAIFAIWTVFVFGVDDIEPVVGEVMTESVAEKSGFRPGDVITGIDGKPVKTWGQHQFYMLHRAMKGAPVRISVSGPEHGERDLVVDFSSMDQRSISARPITSQIGIWPPAPRARVTAVVDGSPAQGAGLVPGDVIVTIDGEPVTDWVDMATRVSGRPGETLLLGIRRDGRVLETPLTTSVTSVDGVEYGRIGLYRPDLENTTLRFGPLEAVWQSMDYNWRMTAITLRSLGRMLTARMSADNLSGPITIARLAGRTAESGYADFMKFLAIISISLGLINLLPIPLLDGGHLAYYLVEAVTGRKPSEKAMLRGQQVGLAMIIMLMGLAFYNDIVRLL